MTHRDHIRDEFTRQARSFARSATLSAPEITARVAAALDPARDRRILDVACGPGKLTEALGERSDYVVGLDYTAAMLRIARDRSPADGSSDFVRGLGERAPFRSGSFDAAVLRLAIHHFDAPVAVLRAVRSALVPGGRLVILDLITSMDPDERELRDAIERLRDPSHVTCLALEELHALVREAGFEVETTDEWSTDRNFSEWAEIINEPVRMSSLETVLRELARGGRRAGIDLREVGDELRFTYPWALVVATAKPTGQGAVDARSSTPSHA